MQTPLTKPPVLREGDTLAAVTLSWGGPATFPHRYQTGKAQLEEAFGVRVVEMPHTLSSPHFLHQNPQARADDLMRAFADPAIDGIISTIGGEDSIRLIPYLDLDVIRKNPKIFMGYSDTTVSHFMCHKAGLGSFYGPSIMAGFAENGGIFPYMRRAVWQVLFSDQPIGEVPVNMDGWTAEKLDWSDPALQAQKRKKNPSAGWKCLQGQGVHQGRLIGGCVEVLDWLRGTPLWPDPSVWKNAVLFLETSEEAPSPEAVQRILRAFAACGILEEINAILFGRPGGNVPVSVFQDYDRMLTGFVKNELSRPHLPLFTRLDFGHTDPMMVLPIGRDCVIDCFNTTITIPENAVL